MKKETRTFLILIFIVLLLPFPSADDEYSSEDTFVSSPVIVSYSDTIHSPARARAPIEAIGKAVGVNREAIEKAVGVNRPILQH